MRRSELELSINWVRRLLPDDDQLVVIGSQSILGAFNEVLLPDDARLSMEVDVLPLHDPDEQKADLIEVMLAATCRSTTLRDLRRWCQPDHLQACARLVEPHDPVRRHQPIRTGECTVAWCAHPADLVANKLIVGRKKERRVSAGHRLLE